MNERNEERLSPLLGAAARAPSPDNNQPWAFSPTADGIAVHHRREFAVPSDVDDLFSWLAIGAAVENLVLAASQQGLRAAVRWIERPFPVENGQETVARIDLSPGADASPLGAAIPTRNTNRGPYRKEPLSAEARGRVETDAGVPGERIRWITDRREIASVAAAVKIADRIRFEYRPFHQELYRMLRFDEAEAAREKDGLSMKALGIARLQVPMIRFLRKWSRMRVANFLGASRAFAGIAAKQVRRSGALLFLASDGTSDQARLGAGREMERLWLAAESAGLAVQPLGSIPLFLLAVRRAPDRLPGRFRDRIDEVRRRLELLFPGEFLDRLVLLFRVGVPRKDPYRSFRYEVDDLRVEGSE